MKLIVKTRVSKDLNADQKLEHINKEVAHKIGSLVLGIADTQVSLDGCKEYEEHEVSCHLFSEIDMKKIFEFLKKGDTISVLSFLKGHNNPDPKPVTVLNKNRDVIAKLPNSKKAHDFLLQEQQIREDLCKEQKT